jgi:hypothetical protein
MTSQEMRSVTVSHVDPSAECTQALLYYSLDDLAHVTCIPLTLAGLSTWYMSLDSFPEDRLSDKDLKKQMKRARLVAQLPVPHVFQGQLWGPVGGRALYSVYLCHQGAYNPFSERGFWLLRDGRLWEVTF